MDIFYKNIIGKKTAFLNLGCKVNAYETEAIKQMFTEAGAVITNFNEIADIYIVNTCTVTNIADKKSRQMLHKAKKMNKHAVVAAIGCYAQSSGEELIKDSAIDLLIGNNKKMQTLSLIDNYLSDTFINPVQVYDISTVKEYEPLYTDTLSEKTRVFIKIQDGCNQFCSYCIIPYARGRSRSRDEGEIINEVVKAASKGYHEIVLTGIHLSSYGTDSPKKNQRPLLTLIKKLDKIDGIERIRLGSLEPRIITEEFAKELASIQKICPHFHLSLQSGCDDTLKRMNRKYTTKQYMDSCVLLRKYFDMPSITTDVIVGFPGESVEEFQDTEEFIKKTAFSQMHIFKFSSRKGTAAADMKDQVSDKVKAFRSSELLSLADDLRYQFEQKHYGKIEEVLFEEEVVINGTRYMTGYTKKYIKVLLETAMNLEQRIIKVKLVNHYQKELLLSELLD